MNLADLPRDVLGLIVDAVAARSPGTAHALRRTCRRFYRAQYSRVNFADPARLLDIVDYQRDLLAAAEYIVTSVRVHDHFNIDSNSDLLMKVPSAINGRRLQAGAAVAYLDAATAAFRGFTNNAETYMRKVITAMYTRNPDDALTWDEAHLDDSRGEYQARAVYMIIWLRGLSPGLNA